MESHSKHVRDIALDVRRFFELGESYRVFHGSSNSTRPRHGSHQNVVDISMLTHVLQVNTESRIALVEPNVPMDRLVEATLAHGLVPPVVMEFPGITAGGGFSGTSGESSSFRHGFFNDTVNSVEIVLGNGDIVQASRQERQDLFHGAAGAAGTLGIVTLMEVRLVEAKKLVKTTYRKVTGISDAVAEVQSQTENPDVDYVDGIMFSREHGVIITGELTDTMPAGGTLRTFSNAHDPWFYMHVSDTTKDLASSNTIVEYIPLGEYLFRYDRAGFWVGRQGYTYFKVIPFTKVFRWLLDDYSHTRTLYHALHASGVSSQFVVQDLALPYETANAFIQWVDQELGIWPLWLCPLRKCALPSFHPATSPQSSKGLPGGEKGASGTTSMSQPMLNIGVWGWGPQDHETFVTKNRQLEGTLKALGGRKWLYAHTYYTEDEFWAEYDRPWYQALREKYFATTLPTIYDKVKVEPRAKWKNPSQWSTSWLTTWPIGGIYGMVLATLSGDIGFHRRATWRYKKE
ncbi:unnamed protein product [Clonostachys rosea]|uniref:Delta(24)-sterol reductase n=1 Tax=Bionectria ochroleuca TaxID=29856 RepID=A0ABY6TYD3_BIOOC|nr:unnamed protein product [Clonostachys rosea]